MNDATYYIIRDCYEVALQFTGNGSPVQSDDQNADRFETEAEAKAAIRKSGLRIDYSAFLETIESQEPIKPTWTYDTRVCDLTEADLEDEVVVIMPGPGNRNVWTLSKVISVIRKDMDRRSDISADDTQTVGEWFNWSDYRFLTQ